jgi:rubrerythrin
MSILLSTIDIFKAAVLLEQRGVKFYEEASQRASGESKKLLVRLSEMEKGHVDHFMSLLETIKNSSRAEAPDRDSSEEEKTFLQALTADRIITDECSYQEGDTLATIYKKAMALEKNAVFFYTAVKQSLKGDFSAEAIDRLIAEELEHFHLLSTALNSLSEVKQ